MTLNPRRRIAALGLVVLMAGLWVGSGAALAEPSGPAVREKVQALKDEWAEVFYLRPTDTQAPRLEGFLARARQLAREYPRTAEPLLMQGLVLCSLAAAEGGFGALGRVREARDRVTEALAIDPLAMEGSGHVILGNLYFRLPGWPLSFGDDALARQHLETALRLFPDELDTNFFQGDFLLEQGEFARALPYLEKAERASVRAESRLSDLKLKQELRQALRDAREGTRRAGFFSQFLAIFTQESRK